MRVFSLLAVLAFAATTVVMGVGLSGCTDLGVGAICLNPREDGTVTGTQLSSPALECKSRLCLLNERDSKGNTLDPPRSTCTARCDSDDDCADALIADPDKPDARQCPNGKKFICAVATQTGPFKCQPICICENDVADAVTGDNSLVNPVNNKSVCPSFCLNDGATCAELQKNLPTAAQ